jgi:hypothetical protein
MFKVNLLGIKHGYRGLKKVAQKCVKDGDFAMAMKYVDYCVKVASQLNWIYADEDLENLLAEVAESVIETSIKDNYQPDETHWVFFDDYCTSYVLALQWMNALSKTGKKILYITSQYTFEKRMDISVLGEIEKMPNVVVEVIPQGQDFDRANRLYQSIINFKASKIILHKAMNSLVQLPLCVLPEGVEVYNINLGDQFFWLGTKCVDYNIEFRPFGASVSVQRRGFRKDQLLMVPFYPANENRPFQGFPAGCEGKLVIFSGGDYYKTFDESGTYWRLVKKILDKHPEVVFLFAAKRGSSRINLMKFISDNHFENRLFYINYRQDIYQVFAHCDIYMGTSPISGSLMSQLAAINAKPILQYYPDGTPDDETEQAICINEKYSISYTSEDEFLEEASKLIVDAEYREKQGRRLQAAMMQPLQFDELVAETLHTNTSQMEIEIRQFDYSLLDKRWLVLENVGFTQVGNYLFSLLGKKLCRKYAPMLYLKNRMELLQSLAYRKFGKVDVRTE